MRDAECVQTVHVAPLISWTDKTHQIKPPVREQDVVVPEPGIENLGARSTSACCRFVCQLSDILFENLAVIPKPVPRLFHRWRVRPDDIPELGGMIRLDQVGEFMHDDVIDYEHRSLD